MCPELLINIDLNIASDLPVTFPSHDKVKAAVSETLRGVITHLFGFTLKSNLEISVTITNDAAIRQINAKHRDKNEPTDVISFPQLTNLESCRDYQEDGPPIVLGDIVLSLETIARQALERDQAVSERFAECLVHGILHLMGYDHIEEAERIRMEWVEDEIIPGVVENFSWLSLHKK